MSRQDDTHREDALKMLEDCFGDLTPIKEKVSKHAIETPSWAYSDSGTRFHVFTQPGAARNAFERVQDAGVVHRYTGAAPSVALHIPWDQVDDWSALRSHADDWGVRLGAINPNLFQESQYKLGSLTNENYAVRDQAITHLKDCVAIASELDSSILSLWFADGTNYPGQGDIRRRIRWMREGLAEVYASMPDSMRMLLEYKFFEPAFYHTDIADWGMALNFCQHLGTKAEVLVDLGHHAAGTNIEHIVAFLIEENRLGGFHFNNKKYADDDLTVGSINPYELFLIYNEIVAAETDGAVGDIAFMIDQAHNIKPKIEAMIQSVCTCQYHYAQACLVNREALRASQRDGDVVRAEEVLQDAYRTDTRPLLAQIRIERDLDPDPLAAYRDSGYHKKVAEERSA